MKGVLAISIKITKWSSRWGVIRAMLFKGGSFEATVDKDKFIIEETE